jgi:hypothetical protein
MTRSTYAIALGVFATCGCSLPSDPSALDAVQEDVATRRDAVTVCSWGSSNLVRNSGFDVVDPIHNPTFATGVVGASSVGWSGAAEWTVYMNSLGDIETKQGGGAIRVRTTAPVGGIVQVFLPYHTGPSRVVAKARVYVVSGSVGLFLGDGGAGTQVASSTTTRSWEWLTGTNAISPANEVTVYATSPGGAEFYVDEVNVVATECGFSSTGDWAFLWAHDTSGSYTPTSLYAASSSGLAPTVDWSGGVGMAKVTLPGVGKESGGNIQVNAYGSVNERCNVGSWSEVGNDVRATVHCTWPNGTPTNTPFVLSYVRKPSPSTDAGGYVFADQPTNPEYVPSLLRQWNSSGTPNVVYRLTTGTYRVDFPGVFVNHGTVLVTAHGAGGAHFTTGGWCPS